MRIAIFLPNWVGDAVMATPALRAIRDRFPSAEITGIMRPVISDTLAGVDLIDAEILFDPRSKDKSLRSGAVIRTMRQQKFDQAILLPNSLRTGWMSWFGNARQRTGIARDGRRFFLNDPIAPRKQKTPYPAFDEYLRIAAHVGCDVQNPKMELAVQPQDRDELNRFWSTQPTAKRDRVVTFNPGGAFGAAKHWPAKSFGTLARMITQELNVTVLVVCGPAERNEAREIVAHADSDDVVSLAEMPPSIGLTKAAIAESELLVTTDSGPRHFAQPFGVPVVSLFGPTHIEWSETHYDHARHVQLDVDCGPCQQRTCPLGHLKCMNDLTPARVMQDVHIAMQAQSARVA